MPKRSRTSHIPSQIQRRKPRRTANFNEGPPASPVSDEAAAPVVASSGGGAAAAVAEPRMGPRLAATTRTRENVGGRAIPGQLPTFERAYLVRELTQIFVISGALLALIIVLALVMR